MKFTPFYLAAIAPLAVASCSGAFLGHVTVLLLTFGIFAATLSLGRKAHTAEAPVDTSAEIEKV